MSLQTYIKPNEQSGATISGTFSDAAGDLFTPTTATYTLTDLFGVVINNGTIDLKDVPITGYTSSYTIELTCGDLSIPDKTKTKRKLLIESTYGPGKCAKEELEFDLNVLVGI